MKKVLMGVCNNIAANKQKIKIWSESFRRFSSENIILLAVNPNADDVQAMEDLNIVYERIDLDDSNFIYHKRLLHEYEYIKKSDADLFLVTDTFDVIFQKDPFEILDTSSYDIFVGSEGLLINEEPWNFNILEKCFNEFRHLWADKPIINSGVICGKKEQMVELLKEMYELCEEHNYEDIYIKDQAALNVVVHKNIKLRIKIFDLNENWTLHCAVAGPTDIFFAWGLVHILTERYKSLPYPLANKIYSGNDKVIPIVHQFNRIPEWHRILTQSYE